MNPMDQSIGSINGDSEDGSRLWPTRTIRFALFVVALAAAFAIPLIRVVQDSNRSYFYSYIPMIPLLSGFLIWMDRARIPRRAASDRPAALVCAFAGMAMFILYLGAVLGAYELQDTEKMALAMSSFLLLLLAGANYILGGAVLRSVAFPVGLCGFMIPPPPGLLDQFFPSYRRRRRGRHIFGFAWPDCRTRKMGPGLTCPIFLLKSRPNAAGFMRE